MTDFAARSRTVHERIEGALARSGRSPGSVRLVAVSKAFPPEAVAEAARAGLTHFGENRVQEAVAKIPEVARLLAGAAGPRRGGEDSRSIPWIRDGRSANGAGPELPEGRVSWHL